MKWFHKKSSILDEPHDNQFYIVRIKQKCNGILLDYDSVDIKIG